MSDDFAAKVGAHTTVVNKGKHLNESAGFVEFPLLLKLVNDGRP